MAPHRILHVLGTAEFGGKSICQMVEYLASGLDSDLYVIEVCFLRCGEFVDRFTTRGIKATCVDWSGSPTDPIGAARYARLLLSSRFDLVHQHTGGRFLTQMTRKIGRAKIVRHVHGRASDETGVVPATMSLPKSDATITTSQIVADSCGDPNAIVIYPGIHVKDFELRRAKSREAVIGTACRLEPVKDIPSLLDSIAIVAKENPAIRLQIAGDGSLRNAFEEAASQLGISDNTTFLGWCSDLASVFSSWDIFVLPSLDEGFGVAVLEAMAASLPVIASDVGGLRELVQDGKTGFLVPAGSAHEFASKMRLLLDDSKLRATMGAFGRQRAIERFSVTAMVQKTAEVYESLLKTPNRRSKKIA